MTKGYTILVGDVLEQLATLPESSVHCCVTSPPYWGLRDYGVDGQIGLEATPEEFIAKMVAVFRAVRRVLREDGTLWLNIGDCYNGIGGPGKQDGGPIGPTAATAIENTRGRKAVGSKPKDLMLMPWRVALALQADGWWVRSAICWAKKSPMPESVSDRPTSSWEPIFLMAKSQRYFYDAEAVKEKASENTNPRASKAEIAHIQAQRDAGANTSVGKGADRKTHGADGMVKTNGSFQNAVCIPVAARNQRNVWHLGPEPFTGWTESVQWVRVAADAVGDDIRRTESPDCPVHGCPGSRQGDAHGGESLNGTGGTDARHGQAQTPSPSSSSPNLGVSDAACSSDSSRHESSAPATPSSKRSRKKAHAHATTPPCTPSAQTQPCTPDTSTPLPTFDSAERTNASKTAAGSASREQETSDGQTQRRTEGTCTCQYHRPVTKKTDHFATFPTEIPRRAILAGTSEKGCCAACGACWVRAVDKQHVPDRPGRVQRENGDTLETAHGADGRAHKRRNLATTTTGWEAGCGCGAGVVPCTVLDPFLGSGTTLAVALQLGRHGIGIELNPEYVKLAHDRIGKAERPHSHRTDKAEAGGLFA